MGNATAKYAPEQVIEWAHYLRRVANKLNSSPENAHAAIDRHFYNVHYAIGPEYLTESDIFELDKEYLRLISEQEEKTSAEVKREIIESLEIVIREGDNLRPPIMHPAVWNSGLKDYLVELLAKLTRKK